MQFHSSYKCAETSELETDAQTDRQAGRQADRQRQTDRDTERVGVREGNERWKGKSVETKKKPTVFWLWFGRDSIPFITL